MALVKRCEMNGVKLGWGRRFHHYSIEHSGVTVHFTDGTSSSGNLLVAADGASSPVRAQLCPAWADTFLVDTSATSLSFAIPLARIQQVETAPLRLLLSRSDQALLRVFGPGACSWLILRYPDDDLKLECVVIVLNHDYTIEGDYAENSTPDDWIAFMMKTAKRANCPPLEELCGLITTKDLIIPPKRIRSADPSKVRSLISASNQSDLDHVALLGDAAHAMTSHRGLGANTAFEDAADLAEMITQNAAQGPERLKTALTAYHAKMILRGVSAVEQSLQTTKMLHLGGPWKAAMRNWFMWTIGWIGSIVGWLISWLPRRK